MKTNCKGQPTIDRETMHSCSEQPPAVMTKAINGLGSKIISPSVTPFFFLLSVEFIGTQSLVWNPIKAQPSRPKPRTPKEQMLKTNQNLHRAFWKVKEIVEMQYSHQKGGTLRGLVTQTLVGRRVRISRSQGGCSQSSSTGVRVIDASPDATKEA